MGSFGTNRWVAVGNSTTRIDVYVPATSNAAEADLAAKARVAIATINCWPAGLVQPDETASCSAWAGYLRVSYLTSYVPLGSTYHASHCSTRPLA